MKILRLIHRGAILAIVATLIIPLNIVLAKSDVINVVKQKPDMFNSKLVVFVHGVLGDHKKTWTNKSTGHYWPSVLAHDSDLDNYDVFSVSYLSKLTKNGLDIEELAIQLDQQLREKNVFDQYEEIFFVTHSMGGIVTKRLLNKLNTPQKLSQLSKVRAVFFLSTPAHGADIANLAKKIFEYRAFSNMGDVGYNTLLEVNENDWNTLLRERDEAKRAHPRSYVAYEKSRTWGIKVVNRLSSLTRTDEDDRPFTRDHFEMAEIITADWKKDDLYDYVKTRILKSPPPSRNVNYYLGLLNLGSAIASIGSPVDEQQVDAYKSYAKCANNGQPDKSVLKKLEKLEFNTLSKKSASQRKKHDLLIRKAAATIGLPPHKELIGPNETTKKAYNRIRSHYLKAIGDHKLESYVILGISNHFLAASSQTAISEIQRVLPSPTNPIPQQLPQNEFLKHQCVVNTFISLYAAHQPKAGAMLMDLKLTNSIRMLPIPPDITAMARSPVLQSALWSGYFPAISVELKQEYGGDWDPNYFEKLRHALRD